MKKRKILISVGIIAMVLISVFAITACADNVGGIAAAQAKKIAMADIGTTEEAVSWVTVEEETVSGKTYYEVEMMLKGIKYSYRIEAESGRIERIKLNDQVIDAITAPITPDNPESQSIGETEAKNVAFADAGISEETEVTALKIEYDFDDGQYLYEIEFRYESKEYEYEIVAANGEIYKKSIENVTVSAPGITGADNIISAEEAENAALTDSGEVAGNVRFVKAKLERENGVLVYEIEFVSAEKKYEYEINAVTGAIIKKDMENLNGSSSGNISGSGVTGGTYIGVERAKEIALSHAGVTVDRVRELEVKLDKDNGIYEYEVEFKCDGWEYDYEINAISGQIIKSDKEPD